MERHKQRGFFVVVVGGGGVEILTLCIIETKIKKKKLDRHMFVF